MTKHNTPQKQRGEESIQKRDESRGRKTNDSIRKRRAERHDEQLNGRKEAVDQIRKEYMKGTRN